MNKILILILTIVSTNISQAEKGDMWLSSLGFIETNIFYIERPEFGGTNGIGRGDIDYSFGLQSNYSLTDKVNIALGVFYGKQGGTFDYYNFLPQSTDYIGQYSYRSNFFRVPILAGYNFSLLKNKRLFISPQLGFQFDYHFSETEQWYDGVDYEFRDLNYYYDDYNKLLPWATLRLSVEYKISKRFKLGVTGYTSKGLIKFNPEHSSSTPLAYGGGAMLSFKL